MPNVLIKTKSGEVLEIEMAQNNDIFGILRSIDEISGSDLVKGEDFELTRDLNDLTSNAAKVQDILMCAVPGCENNKLKNPQKAFFRFPDERVRCHQWVLYCQQFIDYPGKQRLIFSDDLTICSDHFKKDQFVKNTNTLLKRTAVPCVPKRLWESNNKPNVKELVVPSPPSLMNNQDSCQILCRLCSNPSTDCIYIFDEIGLRMKLAHKINLCFPFEVKITDLLPKQVCGPCLNELEELYEMADLCSRTQGKLLDMLGCDEKFTELFSDDDLEELLGICPLCDVGEINFLEIKTENDESTNQLMALENRNKFNEEIPSKIDPEELLIENNSPNPDLGNTPFVLLSSDVSPIPSVNTIDHYNCGDSQVCLPQDSVDITIVENEHSYKTSDEKSTINGCNIPVSSNKSVNDSLKEIFLSCRVCGCEFTEEHKLLEHSFDHSCSAFYQCAACVAVFTVKHELIDHILCHKKDRYVCNICQIEFNLSSSIDSHFCLPQKCTDCLQSFQNEYVYSDHLKSHLSPASCVICCKIFPNEETFKQHKLNVHDSMKSHCCDECGKVFKSEASMKYHQRIHNETENAKRHFCEWCGVYFSRHSSLFTHLTKFHNNSPAKIKCYTCMLCNEAFPDNISAFGHLKRLHSVDKISETTFCFEIREVNRIFVCEFCNRSYCEEYFLHSHRETHPSENPYQCKLCNETFKIKDVFDSHIKSHSNDIPEEYTIDFLIMKLFLCEFCERHFIEYKKYREHLSIHFGASPYECRHCPQVFSSLAEAIQHRSNYPASSSESECSDIMRPYACHFCDKTFGIEDALTKHIRMHTGEKPFICELCGKGFSQSSGLYTHQKVHSSERPYTCPVCPRKFKIKGDRDVHVRKHSGERPYKCDVCGKAFMTQHVFSQHRKIHTDERPYRCDVCSQAFRRSHVLTVHKRIHTGEKPHACPVCTKRYRQKGDMLKHIRIQHFRNEVLDYPKG